MPPTTRSRYMARTATPRNIRPGVSCATPARRSSTRAPARSIPSSRASTRWAIAKTSRSKSHFHRIDPIDLRGGRFAAAPSQPPELHHPVAVLGRDRIPVEQPYRADPAGLDHRAGWALSRGPGLELPEVNRDGDGDRLAAGRWSDLGSDSDSLGPPASFYRRGNSRRPAVSHRHRARGQLLVAGRLLFLASVRVQHGAGSLPGTAAGCGTGRSARH